MIEGTTWAAEDVANEALDIWTQSEARTRINERWAPTLLSRFADVVKQSVGRAPELSKASGLIKTARVVLRGTPELRQALSRDPALGRWTSAMERALSRGARLEPLMALVPRFALASALNSGTSLEGRVTLGSGGRARIPIDGRVLQGPPSRPLRVRVSDGQLATHARAPKMASAFEVIDGDAEAGALPSVQPLSGGSLGEIITPLKRGVDVLHASAPALHDEILALAPTLVAVGAAPGVSHSASLSEARGCIWLTPVTQALVVAETLIHEASHLKFFLVEDIAPLVSGDDPPRFEVPWRSDRRPLRAVLMGLHAWVRVLDWLQTLEGGPHHQAAQERAVILGAATQAAAEIVEGADGLSEAGQALTRALCQRTRDR